MLAFFASTDPSIFCGISSRSCSLRQTTAAQEPSKAFSQSPVPTSVSGWSLESEGRPSQPRMLPCHPHEFGPGVGRALNPPQAVGPLWFGSGVLFPMTPLGFSRRGLGGNSASFRPSGA